MEFFVILGGYDKGFYGISELKELRIIVDKIKNHDYKYDQKKLLSSKEIWEKNLEGIFVIEESLNLCLSICYNIRVQYWTEVNYGKYSTSVASNAIIRSFNR